MNAACCVRRPTGRTAHLLLVFEQSCLQVVAGRAADVAVVVTDQHPGDDDVNKGGGGLGGKLLPRVLHFYLP